MMYEFGHAPVERVELFALFQSDTQFQAFDPPDHLFQGNPFLFRMVMPNVICQSVHVEAWNICGRKNGYGRFSDHAARLQ